MSCGGFVVNTKLEEMTGKDIGIRVNHEYKEFNSSKRSSISKVWEEMQRIQTNEGSKVQCNHCGKLLQDNCGTSHLKRHLIRCPKNPKPLNTISPDSMASTCIGGTGNDKESGPNAKFVVQPVKAEPRSEVKDEPQSEVKAEPQSEVVISAAPNFLRPTVAACTIKVTGSLQQTSSTDLLSDIVSTGNQMNLTSDDVEMKAFYASLEAETSVLSPSQDAGIISEEANITLGEETRKALKRLKDFLSEDFSALLHSGQCSAMKTTLEYLSNMSEDDGIFADVRLLILEISREFTQWSLNYNDASRKIESSSANLLKADKIKEGLEANKNQFMEVLSLTDELSYQLAHLKRRKKELEEQITAIETNISTFKSAENSANKRKREIFEEAKMLKAQRDGLKEHASDFRDEWESAKKIQADIRAEWSKLGEKFNKSLSGVNCDFDNGSCIQPSYQQN